MPLEIIIAIALTALAVALLWPTSKPPVWERKAYTDEERDTLRAALYSYRAELETFVRDSANGMADLPDEKARLKAASTMSFANERLTEVERLLGKL